MVPEAKPSCLAIAGPLFDYSAEASARAKQGLNVKENVLAVLDPQNVLLMERGSWKVATANSATPSPWRLNVAQTTRKT